MTNSCLKDSMILVISFKSLRLTLCLDERLEIKLFCLLESLFSTDIQRIFERK